MIQDMELPGPSVRVKKTARKLASSEVLPAFAFTMELSAWVSPGGEPVTTLFGFTVTVHPAMARNWALALVLLFVVFGVLDTVDEAADAVSDSGGEQ